MNLCNYRLRQPVSCATGKRWIPAFARMTGKDSPHAPAAVTPTCTVGPAKHARDMIEGTLRINDGSFFPSSSRTGIHPPSELRQWEKMAPAFATMAQGHGCGL